MSSLPKPDVVAATQSQHLLHSIIQSINVAGGKISFAEFMRQALYTPTLGYYSGPLHKFGIYGDFVTAPEISPLFSQCLARQCQQVLAHLKQGTIVEFGAGSGIMAAELLKELQQLDSLPQSYWIIELSADLQQQQQETLRAHVPKLLNRIQWLEQLPSQPFDGIILANEVLDAMPVERFQVTEDTIQQFYVSYQSEQLIWQLDAATPELSEAVHSLAVDFPDGYVSEINLALSSWIQALAATLNHGLILLIDYGFPQHEYYHPQRNQGTLMCHYRHHAHVDPLILLGLQDITAHVDFTAVAQAAIAANLEVAGYAMQANFLLSTGLLDKLNAYSPEDTRFFQLSQQAKLLTLPSEMGELFKVMALTQNLDIPLIGFGQDERRRL
ncbi:MAG: SAM-dependent methyltransferase [Thiotrichaceae bacterium]